MPKFSIVLVSLILFGCQQNLSSGQTSSDKEIENENWEIVSQNDFSERNYVEISFRNKTNLDITVYDPLLSKIEFYENGEWKKVRTLYCDCSPCPPPPEQLDIISGDNLFFKWDKMEEECKGGDLTGSIPSGGKELIRTKAKTGKYRVSYSYKNNLNNKKENLIAVFTL